MATRKIGTFLKRKVSIDKIQHYLSCGLTLHPHVYFFYVDQLSVLESKEKVCLVPDTIFQRFHLRFKKVINF